VPIFLKSGSLIFLEPSGPFQACIGVALPLPLPFTDYINTDTVYINFVEHNLSFVLCFVLHVLIVGHTFWEQSGLDISLPSRLVPRLRMGGDIPPYSMFLHGLHRDHRFTVTIHMESVGI